jgi:hypothetical protein
MGLVVWLRIRQSVDVPADPEQIKREIEDIRSELADTVEELSARVSPKAVAGRSATATKEWFGLAPAADGASAAVARIRWERIAGVGAVVALLVARRLRKRAKKKAKAKH